jgi:hypothetical protein
VNANTITCSSAGTCTYATCQQGHVDDDRNRANGCEGDCGGSGDRCCEAPLNACNNGDACKQNESCPQ